MKAQENSTKAKDSAREPALVRRLSGPVAVNSARELVPCSAARVRTHVAEAAEAARVSLHRAREAACARMCAQPPVFVSTTQNKTNKAATGPMFSSFESKITACFREYRTKRKPQGGNRGRNSKEAEARCLQRPVFMSAAPNKTHLPKETKPTCQKK